MTEQINNEFKKAIDEWFVKQCRLPFNSFYLYYKPRHIEFTIAENAPEGFELALPERISPAFSKETVYGKYRNVLNTLPILA